MCPFFSTFILLLLFLAPQFIICSALSWNVQFTPDVKSIHMSRTEPVGLQINDLNYNDMRDNDAELQVRSENDFLAVVDKRIEFSEIDINGHWNGSFDLYAKFMGNARIYVEMKRNKDNTTERAEQILPVIITRKETVINTIFNISVAMLVSILYINFGAALNMDKLTGIIRKPIGPCIGFFGQFVIMPLLSYGIGVLLFPTSPEMQLGLFFTGASPAGGASNIWTVILGGNLDLSITMTTISTIAAFAMMPLWLFTLGRVIFDRGEIAVPYRSLSTYVIALIVPLAIGILIQKYLPRVGSFLVRILKTLSIFLILFIVIFAIVTNLYLFQLFSWQIILAGLGLPWLGYILGYLVSKIFRQNPSDSLAIALETGIQNTGIAIFVLRFSLPQPQADLTTIVPVSVAIMTPLPLICLYIGQKIRDVYVKKNKRELLSNDSEIANGNAYKRDYLENTQETTNNLT